MDSQTVTIIGWHWNHKVHNAEVDMIKDKAFKQDRKISLVSANGKQMRTKLIGVGFMYGKYMPVPPYK
jgi:hypothetical protein